MRKRRLFRRMIAASLLGGGLVSAAAISAGHAQSTDAVNPDCLSRPIPLQVGDQKFHVPHLSILRLTVVAPRITRSDRLSNVKQHQMVCKLTDNGRRFLKVSVFELLVISVKSANSKFCDSGEQMPPWLERFCADPRDRSDAGYPLHVGISDLNEAQSGVVLAAGRTISTHSLYLESRENAAWKENAYIFEVGGKVKRYADNYLIAKDIKSGNGDPLTAHCVPTLISPRRTCFVSYVSAPGVKTQWSYSGEEEIMSKQLLRTYPIVGEILDSVKVSE